MTSLHGFHKISALFSLNWLCCRVFCRFCSILGVWCPLTDRHQGLRNSLFISQTPQTFRDRNHTMVGFAPFSTWVASKRDEYRAGPMERRAGGEGWLHRGSRPPTHSNG